MLDFLACGPLLCGIKYLGMADEVDFSESDDSVSEHEELVLLSTIESSGAGVDVFLAMKAQRKDLAAHERQKHIPVKEFEIPNIRYNGEYPYFNAI